MVLLEYEAIRMRTLYVTEIILSHSDCFYVFSMVLDSNDSDCMLLLIV